jgi:transposase
MSLVSAVTQERVLANQVIEGNVSGVLFENFIYQVLAHLRGSPDTCEREIVIFMDNARIHKHPLVLETAARFNAHILFNSEYSPWLNPVEQWFGKVKRHLRSHEVRTR